MHINPHYLKLKAGYLFPELARRVAAFAAANPEAQIIKLGIGDVTEALPEAVVVAMHKAVDDMSQRQTFRGYGPEQGYPWLRQKIAEHEYHCRGCEVDPDEIFVSDGSKCDTGNILDILGPGNSVAVLDPVYPVYVDTNVMAGGTGAADVGGRYGGLTYLPATAENDFSPALPAEPVDVIYLCYPNNPTGAVADRERLQEWVNYAGQHGSLILFDAAYEAYITDGAVPHSIYEIDGARDVAIEFRSFSKNAGFTGTRCAWVVVPQQLVATGPGGRDVALHRLWHRRQTTRFNGVSYVVQRGAEAVYSPDGQRQVRRLVSFYLENARILRQGLADAGVRVYGGINAPYVWVRVPGSDRPGSSWDFFDLLLHEAQVVTTPGSGFGECGEGYVRLSAFNSRENIKEAMGRIGTKLAV